MALEVILDMKDLGCIPLKNFNGGKMDKYISFLSIQPVVLDPEYEDEEKTEHEKRFIRIRLEQGDFFKGQETVYVINDRGKINDSETTLSLGTKIYREQELDRLIKKQHSTKNYGQNVLMFKNE